MKRSCRILALCGLLLALIQPMQGQDRPFQVISILDAPSIAGRSVNLDAKGKLLPWPMRDSTGYSYSA